MKCKNCGCEYFSEVVYNNDGDFDLLCDNCGTNHEPETLDCEKCGNRPNLHSRLCKVKEPEVEK